MSQASATTSSTAASSMGWYDNSTATRTVKKTLDQEDFLKLLAAQMSAQDPLSPMKETEFLGQMAQFTALEQTRAMQQEQRVLQANGLIGRAVDLQVDQDKVVQGVVSGLNVQSGVTRLVVDGSLYDLDQVISVSVPQLQPNQP